MGELELFQPVMPEYHIKVWGAERGYTLIFGHGEARVDQRYIWLPKQRVHYHGLTSVTAFMGLSYYYLTCEKGYNDEDYDHCPCVKRRCVPCKQTDCTEYLKAMS